MISNCTVMIPARSNNPFPTRSTYNGTNSVAELKLLGIILSYIKSCNQCSLSYLKNLQGGASILQLVTYAKLDYWLNLFMFKSELP